MWFAATAVEESVLTEYADLLKADPRRRFPERPHHTVVVQEAVSHFYPSQPRWVSNAPEQEHFLCVSRGFYSAEMKQSVEERQTYPHRAAPASFYSSSQQMQHQQHHGSQQQSYF